MVHLKLLFGENDGIITALAQEEQLMQMEIMILL